jgi:hypothetical protein
MVALFMMGNWFCGGIKVKGKGKMEVILEYKTTF